MRQIQHQPYDWNVVAAEARGFLPVIAVAKQSDDGNGVPRAAARPGSPDAGGDRASANFMDDG